MSKSSEAKAASMDSSIGAAFFMTPPSLMYFPPCGGRGPAGGRGSVAASTLFFHIESRRTATPGMIPDAAVLCVPGKNTRETDTISDRIGG